MIELEACRQNDLRLFEVEYMLWEDFRKILLSDGDEWEGLESKYDCIIGGIDYTVDWRFVPFLLTVVSRTIIKS